MELSCTKCGSDNTISDGANRRRCKACGYKGKPQNPTETKEVEGKRWVITSAVSGSPAHLPFLRTLEVYCKTNKAELLIVPTRYHNNHNPG